MKPHLEATLREAELDRIALPREFARHADEGKRPFAGFR
jgi:hypothetical protein